MSNVCSVQHDGRKQDILDQWLTLIDIDCKVNLQWCVSLAFASFGSYDQSGFNVFKNHWCSSFFFEMTLHRGDRFCIEKLIWVVILVVKENYNKLAQQYIRTGHEEQSRNSRKNRSGFILKVCYTWRCVHLDSGVWVYKEQQHPGRAEIELCCCSRSFFKRTPQDDPPSP